MKPALSFKVRVLSGLWSPGVKGKALKPVFLEAYSSVSEAGSVAGVTQNPQGICALSAYLSGSLPQSLLLVIGC